MLYWLSVCLHIKWTKTVDVNSINLKKILKIEALLVVKALISFETKVNKIKTILKQVNDILLFNNVG